MNTPPDSNDSRPSQPGWAERIQQLVHDLHIANNETERDQLLGDVWVLLKASLLRYLQYHAARTGRVSPEDMEDLAAQKTFDLLRKVELGEWDLDGRHPGEIVKYLSRVAHNGLLNWLKVQRRTVPVCEEDIRAQNKPSQRRGITVAEDQNPMVEIERQEFIRELQHCVGKLSGRTQRIWFLRAFCEMRSKAIARHPEVRLKASNVDIILQRSRDKIKSCLKRKGYERRDMPPGTFTALWLGIMHDRR